MTAAGQKTDENFFLTGKYREQKTGVFKGKKAGRIFWGKKQPDCQWKRMKRKLPLDRDTCLFVRAPERVQRGNLLAWQYKSQKVEQP